MKIEYVRYTGFYPCLCHGILVVRVDGVEWKIKELVSGGSVNIDAEWNEAVTEGEWEIEDWPKGFPKKARAAVIRLANERIAHGCCGGCV